MNNNHDHDHTSPTPSPPRSSFIIIGNNNEQSISWIPSSVTNWWYGAGNDCNKHGAPRKMLCRTATRRVRGGWRCPVSLHAFHTREDRPPPPPPPPPIQYIQYHVGTCTCIVNSCCNVPELAWTDMDHPSMANCRTVCRTNGVLVVSHE